MSKLLEIADIPNFAPQVRTGQLPLKRILQLRNSANGDEFRDWFHSELAGTDVKEIAKAYVSLIQQIPEIDTTEFRVMRILTWAAAGGLVGASVGPPGSVIGSAAGLAAGVATSLFETFVVPKLNIVGSPKIFLDKLRTRIKN